MKTSQKGSEKFSSGRKVGPQQREEALAMRIKMGLPVLQNRQTRRVMQKMSKKLGDGK